MTKQEFIKKRPYLLWGVHNLDKVSDGLIVEAVLNYGDMNDVKEMIKIFGINKAAKIFRKQIEQKRNNYDKRIKNYFTLFFNKYA